MAARRRAARGAPAGGRAPAGQGGPAPLAGRIRCPPLSCERRRPGGRVDHCYHRQGLGVRGRGAAKCGLPAPFEGLFSSAINRRFGDQMEVEIGRGKKGRRAYGFDEIAIVPSRRTRDPDDVDISWALGPYRFELPLLASAMDGVVSPATAAELGRLGGLGVLNLEGIWTRYEDPDSLFEEIAALEADKATARMQQLYSEPMKPELVQS